MMRIATVVGTYKRPQKLEALIRNHNETSSEAELYFVITPDDKESQECLEKLGQNYFVVDLEYTQSVNYAYRNTNEEFILCGADDIEFMPGWDKKLLEMADRNPDKHIFGGIDSWEISKTMLHISHPFVRRSYADKQGYLYWTEYIHYMNDIELVQKGLKEGCVMITPEILIEHNNPLVTGTEEEKKNPDETYTRSRTVLDRDNDIYNRRSGEFAMYDHDRFFGGLCPPTKLNPLYNKTLLSIVIPVYNAKNNLIRTLRSVVNQTFYRFELILIDDASDAETAEFIDSIEMQDKSLFLVRVRNGEQRWINYNWNTGADLAKGNYVAFLNSDIDVSPEWDKWLIAGLEKPAQKSTIACPYFTDTHVKKPTRLFSLFEENFPQMIQGSCFMVRKEDVRELFPIPSEIKHWCGDNWIADKAGKMNGVYFTDKATIYHYVTRSGVLVPRDKYMKRIKADVEAYERLSGRNMDFVKKTFDYQEKRLGT